MELRAAVGSGAELLGGPGEASGAETSVGWRRICVFDTLEVSLPCGAAPRVPVRTRGAEACLWGACRALGLSEAPPGRTRAGFWGGRPGGNCSNRSNCSPAALVRGVVHEGRPQGSALGGLQRMCGRTEAGTWHRGPGRWWLKEWLS